MRAATKNELDDAWFAQPEEVIALIEDAIPRASTARHALYGVLAALGLAICIITVTAL